MAEQSIRRGVTIGVLATLIAAFITSLVEGLRTVALSLLSWIWHQVRLFAAHLISPILLPLWSIYLVGLILAFILILGLHAWLRKIRTQTLDAPSDFKDQESFLNMLAGTRKVSLDVGEITQQLEEAKDQILKQAVQEITTAGGTERSKLSALVNQQLEQIATRLKSVQQAANEVAATPSARRSMPLSNLQSGILHFLDESAPEPVPLGEVYRKFARADLTKVRQALDSLVEYGVVVQLSNAAGDYSYKSQD